MIDKIYFQISNLLYAEPVANRCASYLGGRKAEIEKIFTVRNPNGYVFKIEKHYSEYLESSQNSEVVSSQNLVSVSTEHKINQNDVNELNKEAKDFALLLTFAARHKVMVLGYEYLAGSKRVRCYKDPTDRLKVKNEEVVEDALIPIEFFETFMNEALAKWHKMDEKTKRLINDAIVSIHPLNNSNQSYLNMFSALEGLIKQQSMKVEVVQEIQKNWTDIIEPKFIFAINELNLSEETRSHLLSRLVSLKDGEKFTKSVESILGKLGVVTNDLWPVVGTDSLYSIRNSLAHGERTQLDSVYLLAQEHLQFLLERLVLAFLGFDYNKSTVGLINHGIRFRYSQQEIKEFQNQLKTTNKK